MGPINPLLLRGGESAFRIVLLMLHQITSLAEYLVSHSVRALEQQAMSDLVPSAFT